MEDPGGTPFLLKSEAQGTKTFFQLGIFVNQALQCFTHPAPKHFTLGPTL